MSTFKDFECMTRDDLLHECQRLELKVRSAVRDRHRVFAVALVCVVSGVLVTMLLCRLVG